MAVIKLTWEDIERLVSELATRLPAGSCCWGVPRGGSVVAALLRSNHGINISAESTEATIAVDDIIDSGRTATYVWNKYGLKVEALIVKETTDWIVFPWEGTELSEDAENTVTRFLQQIGEDPNRRELERMPKLVVNYWDRLFSGYRYGNEEILDLLWNGSSAPLAAHDDQGMVVLPGISYVSSCEKHLIPFYGEAHVGYLPSALHGHPGNVARLVYALSRRLQVQERLTGQISEALACRTEGTAVMLEGNYLCPLVQGRTDRQTAYETAAFAGRIKNDTEFQKRFLVLSKQGEKGQSDQRESSDAG